MRQVIVEPEVWDLFPFFKRGLVIVQGMRNSAEEQDVAQFLEIARARRAGGEVLQEDFILCWDEMHRRFGSNPNKYPPSIKSLLKRAAKGPLPFVNTAVALFNAISLEYLLPCGGDDLASIDGDLRLGLAKGDEHFLPLGGSEEEQPVPGEVIYYDGATRQVMCRRWNWRNGDFSKITEATDRMVINVDGAGPVPLELVLGARDRLAHMLACHCQAQVETALLTRAQPSLAIPV
jgi:DNA/RNA-binding domain of Phe-tRNA-synthetase-like protein